MIDDPAWVTAYLEDARRAYHRAREKTDAHARRANRHLTEARMLAVLAGVPDLPG